MCAFVCVYISIMSHITAESTVIPLVLVRPRGIIIKGSMILTVCVFIKLHITAQSGPAILVVLCCKVLVLALPNEDHCVFCVFIEVGNLVLVYPL